MFGDCRSGPWGNVRLGLDITSLPLLSVATMWIEDNKCFICMTVLLSFRRVLGRAALASCCEPTCSPHNHGMFWVLLFPPSIKHLTTSACFWSQKPSLRLLVHNVFIFSPHRRASFRTMHCLFNFKEYFFYYCYIWSRLRKLKYKLKIHLNQESSILWFPQNVKFILVCL